ncbi:hypothetical protein C8J57DRAFT_1663148 [Mycena rebaudengoi]|nr:hypothetical protein C8J57DRAFT_1663148 [Mycena rebaudengoi]
MHPDEGSSKSVTPLRKHRKLLKDGSGTAVWPEEIESVFLQGLRAYWDSPWATYSRGRSRWRNQFLVDYLQNLGIVRTKKQVASHIQVLRNMLKGEPEYHLVAGGEELCHESSPIKVELDHPTLLTIDREEPDATPEFTSADFPPSPETSPMFPTLTYSPSSPMSSVLDSPPHPYSALASPYQQPAALYVQKPYPTSYQGPPPQLRYPNRLTSFTLHADGMTPLSINIDKLAPPAPPPAPTPPLALRLKLSISPVDDQRGPPQLARLLRQRPPRQHLEQHRKVCHPRDPLVASSVDLGTVVAALPESGLSRCRWFDPLVHTIITQDIVVDGVTLLFVVYELDRRNGGALPSAELSSCQKYPGAGVAAPKPPPPAPFPSSYFGAAGMHPQIYVAQPFSPSSYRPSLSSALTPVPT